MPDLVNSPTIQVNTKNGRQKMRNPLSTYTFHPKPDGSVFPPGEVGAQFPNTVRRPSTNGNSQPDLVNADLASNAGS
ncbi:hypothetical protein GP486_003193 [Trichoglossum hirsutum]|uniref:Uncharacterized protein n=1 Tax=Trichoglossum hirsutum TaxID=265104 RepID=A0A9P8RRE2_9PEZI|nr:hypothetical protein GP486_003193 [Trichoglossum hirsutum]